MSSVVGLVHKTWNGSKSMTYQNSATPLELPGSGQTRQHTRDSSTQLGQARQRLPINLLSNFVWLVVNMGVNLWYTPYLIAHLGVSAYGLVPLAGSVTSYMTVLTTALNDAISRFLTIDLAKKDLDAANRTFNTAIVSSLIVIALLLPVALVISWFGPQIFNIPPGHEQDAQWLLLLSTMTFLTTTFASTFAVSSYAQHRFDLRLLVNTVRLGAQLVTVVLLFNLLTPSLWQAGLGMLVSAFLLLLGHRELWRKLTPELTLKLGLFDQPLLKQFMAFSGWVLVNSMGAMLFLNIDLIVANLIFGPEVAGRYGAVVIFPSVLRAVAGTANAVLVPIVMTLYAQGNLSGLARFSRLSVKSMGLMVALPIGLLCGLGKPLLTVWLGPEFSDLSPLVVALVAHLCINLAVSPLFSLQVATNKVRVPALVTLAMGLANAALAVSLSLWTGWGYISIAIAGAIVLIMKNALFTPLYNARILGLSWWAFLPALGTSVVGCLSAGAMAYLISLNWSLTGWVQLISACALVSVAYLVAVFFLGLSADDRRFLKSEMQRRMKHE